MANRFEQFIGDGAEQPQNRFSQFVDEEPVDNKPWLTQHFWSGVGDVVGLPGTGLDYVIGKGAEALGFEDPGPLFGSEALNKTLEKINLTTTQAPTTDAQMLARGAGQGVGGGIGAAGLGARLAQSSNAVTRGVGQTLTNPYTKMPGATLAADAGGGAGEVVARLSSQRAGDSDAEQFMAGLAGATAGALSAGGLVSAAKNAPLKLGWKAARGTLNVDDLRSNVSDMDRAARVVQGAVGDADVADARLAQSNSNTLPLTNIQTVNDPGLNQLGKRILRHNPDMQSAYEQQIAQINKEAMRQVLAKSGGETAGRARQLFGSAVDTMRNTIEKRKLAAMDIIEQRLNGAREEVQNALDRMPNADPDQLASITYRAVKSAHDDFDAMLKDAWSLVDFSIKYPMAATRKVYNGLSRKYSSAFDDQMPRYFKDFMAKNKGPTVSVRELQGQRSRLLEDARNAAANGHLTLSKMLYELAEDGIMKDIGVRSRYRGPNADALQDALAKTNAYNNKFIEGPVGRILGLDSSRAGGIEITQALQSVLPKLSPTNRGKRVTARINIIKIRESLKEAGHDTKTINDTIRDALAIQFQDLSPAQRPKWFKVNQKIIPPGLQKQMRAVLKRDMNLVNEQAAAKAGSREAAAAARGMDKKVTRSPENLFSDAQIGGEFENVMNRAQDPVRAIRILKQRAANADRLLGEGVDVNQASLKEAALEFFLKNAQSGKVDVGDTSILSSDKILSMLNDPNTAQSLEVSLGKTDVADLKKIADELQAVERDIRATSDAGPIVTEQGLSLLQRMAGAAGAFAGRKLNTGTIQVPGYAADFGRTLAKLIETGRTEEIVIDALLHDKQLLRDLLTRVPAKETPLARRLLNRLNEAFLTYLTRAAIVETQAQGRNELPFAEFPNTGQQVTYGEINQFEGR